MKNIKILLLFLVTLLLIPYYAGSQEEGFDEILTEEMEEGLPEEAALGEEISFIEEGLPQEEGIPLVEELAAPAIEKATPVEPAPSPAVVVTPPPVTTQLPQSSALSEEESKAVPPPVTANMFPEPTPGTFMKRPNVLVTAPFEYVVKEGDDLHFLAARFYGNARLWRKIYDANRSVLGNNPNSLKKGIVLVIPSIE